MGVVEQHPGQIGDGLKVEVFRHGSDVQQVAGCDERPLARLLIGLAGSLWMLRDAEPQLLSVGSTLISRLESRSVSFTAGTTGITAS